MAALPLAPELATLVDKPPEGPGWFHEPKLDGYRVLAQLRTERSGREVALWTRRGHDWTSRAPVVAEALKAVPARGDKPAESVVAEKPKRQPRRERRQGGRSARA